MLRARGVRDQLPGKATMAVARPFQEFQSSPIVGVADEARFVAAGFTVEFKRCMRGANVIFAAP